MFCVLICLERNTTLKALVLSLRFVWCHGSHVNVHHASDAKIIIILICLVRYNINSNSGTELLLRDTKMWDFSIHLAGWESIILPRKMKVEPDLSLEQDKFWQGSIVRNPCECSLFRLRYSCTWFLYFYTFPSMLQRLSTKSFSYFKLQWLTKLFYCFLLHINYLWSLNMDWIFNWIVHFVQSWL